MSIQEHFHVFETLLYGLAIAHILIGLSKMMDHIRTIRFYWLHLLTVITVLMMIVHRYFIAFNSPSFAAIQYAYEFLLLIFLPLSCIFFLTYQIIPSKVKGVNFMEFFWSRSTIILALFIVLQLLLIFRNYMEASILYEGNIPKSYMNRAIYPIIGFSFLGIIALIAKKRALISLIIILGSIFIAFLISTSNIDW